jgi:CO/xanthine dehydrogenase FAD-binding subunit
MFDFASYHRAATLADAINLLADNPQAKLLAGGTDVLIGYQEAGCYDKASCFLSEERF